MFINCSIEFCVDQQNFSFEQDILLYASKEFSSSDTVVNGVGGYKPVSWSGMRYMITEVNHVHVYTIVQYIIII